jgi:hypothetical protein
MRTSIVVAKVIVVAAAIPLLTGWSGRSQPNREGGCKATITTTLTTGNTIEFAAGVAVLEGGNVLIADMTGVVYTYAPAKGGSPGSPLATTV